MVLFALVLLVTMPLRGGRQSVSAEPKAPHVLFGIAKTSDDTPVGSNLTVQARIGNVHYGQSVNAQTGVGSQDTRTHAVNSSGLNYGSSVNFQVCADDPNTSATEGGKLGDAISFFFNGIAATVIVSGTSQSSVSFDLGAVQRVDLVIPSLSASQAAGATASADACETQAAPTPVVATPAVTATPTTSAGFPGADPTATPIPAGVVLLATPTPTPTLTPTPIVVTDIIDAGGSVDDIVDALVDVDPDVIVDLLTDVDDVVVADILTAFEVSKAAEIVGLLDTSKAADVVELVDTATAAGIVELVDTAKAADIIQLVETTKAAAIVELVETSKAAAIIDLVETSKAANVIERVDTAKAADVLALVDKVKAGAIFEAITTVKLTGIIQLMSAEAAADRLPEMSPLKLFEIPAVVLFTRLRNVAVEQLAVGIPPAVNPDLPAPTARQLTDDLVEYTIGETRGGDWATFVGSPPPIERILVKSARDRFDVKVLMESLAQKPPELPDLPPERIANTFFKIDIENAQAGDIQAAHVSFFIEKSWLQANDVHKWSIQFNGFNEDLNTWVPFSTKRVREDEERISYTVVVPGFSNIAITGSKELPAQFFEVTDLDVVSLSASGAFTADEDVIVNASVTNNGATRAVYPANLWVNDVIDETHLIVVEPGETIPIRFNRIRPAGDFLVRVERLLSEFTIGAAPPPRPPIVPTATPTRIPIVIAITPTITPTPAPGVATVTARAAVTPTATLPPGVATPTPSAVPTELAQVVTPEVGVTITETAVPTATAIPTPSEGLGAGAIVAIIIGVLAAAGAIGGGSYLYLRRRPPPSAPPGGPPEPGAPAAPVAPPAVPAAPAPPEPPEVEDDAPEPDDGASEDDASEESRADDDEPTTTENEAADRPR